MSALKRWVFAAAISITLVDGEAAQIALFDPLAPTTPVADNGLMNVSFVPNQNLVLTGMGLSFDPIYKNVTPSLYLSIWQDTTTVSNSDRLALLAPVLGDDFTDAGPANYLFRLADDQHYGSPAEILLQANRTYFLLIQINIDAILAKHLGTQSVPYQTADGLVTVVGGGAGFEGVSPIFPSFFIEAVPVSEPPTLALFGTPLTLLYLVRRSRSRSRIASSSIR